MAPRSRPSTVTPVSSVVAGVQARPQVGVIVAAALISAATTGCSSAGSCTIEVPCPPHGVAAMTGDYHLVFAPTSVMTVAPIVLPIRGELLFSPPVCPSSTTTDGCSVTIKELALDFDTLLVQTAVGDLHVDAVRLWLDSAVSATRVGKSYVVPAGALMHSCALVNGRRWHANAPTQSDLTLDLTVPTQAASLAGAVPLSLRAGDANCSQFLLSGDVLATGTTPWNTAP